MNVSKLLGNVEKLHQRAAAAGFRVKRIMGKNYHFEFNGRNWTVTCPENQSFSPVEYNTRSIGQAETWLRQYLKD